MTKQSGPVGTLCVYSWKKVHGFGHQGRKAARQNIETKDLTRLKSKSGAESGASCFIWLKAETLCLVPCLSILKKKACDLPDHVIGSLFHKTATETERWEG